GAIQAGTNAVVCWGLDNVGQATPPPSVDGTAGSASAIAAGLEHSCAIQAATGAVVCWGGNDEGQATPPPSVDGTGGTASAVAAGGGGRGRGPGRPGARRFLGGKHLRGGGPPSPPRRHGRRTPHDCRGR